MKANELMIGDWVQIVEPCKYAGAIGRIKTLIDHKDDENAYFKVFLQNNTIHIGIEDICSEDIRPIPLTKEILEKIGLRKGYAAEYYDQDIYSDEFDTFGLIEGIDGSYVFETYTDWCKRCPDGSPEDYGISTVNNIVGIKYLHELQHAFKLCGITREIII